MTKNTIYIIGAIILILLAAWAYTLRGQGGQGETSNSVASSTLTTSNDQIFDEVSSQFGFARADVSSFSIYGNDRVQYYLLSNRATTFAYKDGGSWHIAGPDASQEAPLCSLLANVPERYRQACYEPATDQTLYVNESGDNANYPFSQRIKYI